MIQRLGSRLTMLGMSAGAIACSLVMAGLPLDPTDTFMLMVMFALTGGLLNAVQTTMYALAANVYPTEIRSTGVGTAVAVGRIGNVLAVYVGSWALGAGGPSGYFTSWAILMGLVLVSLASVRRHVPGSAVAGAPATASTH
jgi:AAHS family 4-hydroxybenzoate transporter-like MFS transporter